MMLRRGELWWAALDPTLGSEISKTRPCLILTTDVVNEHRRTVVVIPLSTSPVAHPPVTVPIVCQGRRAVAVIDQIRAISKQRLRTRIGVASPSEMAAIEDALREILEIG